MIALLFQFVLIEHNGSQKSHGNRPKRVAGTMLKVPPIEKGGGRVGGTGVVNT